MATKKKIESSETEEKPAYAECDIEGKRTFVVGDIHGCFTEFEAMFEYVKDQHHLGDGDVVVFIGDYIDRGPDSKTVIDYLIDLRDNSGAEVAFLRGNHEEMLLDYLGLGGNGGDVFLINGGGQTFESYGLPKEPSPQKALEGLPEEHLAFFQNLDRYILSDKFVFVHAGLNPIRDLHHQLDEDLFWIRDEFIHNLHYFKKTVVFGHTPFEDVLFHLPYKIGVDSGLVYGNALTVVELRDEIVMQVPSGTTEIEEFTFAQKGGLWPQLG